MINKKNDYIDMHMCDLQRFVRNPNYFNYVYYEGAKHFITLSHEFIIAKNVLESQLLQGLYGK